MNNTNLTVEDKIYFCIDQPKGGFFTEIAKTVHIIDKPSNNDHLDTFNSTISTTYSRWSYMQSRQCNDIADWPKIKTRTEPLLWSTCIWAGEKYVPRSTDNGKSYDSTELAGCKKQCGSSAPLKSKS